MVGYMQGSKKARNTPSLSNQYTAGGPKKQGGASSVGHESPYLQYIQKRATSDPSKPYVFARYVSTFTGVGNMYRRYN
jgi:hypothetical protein